MMDKAKNTEKLLLDAALSLFSEKGYYSTKVSEIVKSANVSQGTFYLYFKTKEEIFIKLTDQFLQTILNEMEGLSNQLKESNYAAKIEKMVERGLRLIYENKRLAKLTFIYKYETSTIYQSCCRHEEEIRSLISKILKDYPPYKHFSDEQFEMLVYSVYSIIQRLAHEWLINRNEGDVYISHLSEVITSLIIK